MTVRARFLDSLPFVVEDISGSVVFQLIGNPHGLNMYGDAYVFGHAFKSQGGTSWETTSDRRLKQDVRAYEPGLKEVLQLRPVRFRYRDNPKMSLTSAHEEVGFIAQEVREVIPDAVAEGKDGYLTLKADPIHWAAINAIQGLNEKVEVRGQKSEDRIQKLESENTELKQRLDALEKTFTIRNKTKGTKP